ncbi:LPXTG cell wall anchor domain-containing protein, partial [Listeria booriae]
PEGYQLSDKTFPVTISTDKQKIDLGTISNEKTPPPVEPKGSLAFEKVDSADATIKLADATFQLINQATQEVYATITTDKTGLGSLSDIPAGEYTLKETKAPEGYQLADKTYPVTISEDQQTVDLKNIPNTKVPSNPVPPFEPTTPDQPEKPIKPITPSCPILPSVPSTPSASTPITPVNAAEKTTRIVSEVTPSAPIQTLPTTGDTSNDTLPWFGGLLILSTGGYFLIRRKG